MYCGNPYFNGYQGGVFFETRFSLWVDDMNPTIDAVFISVIIENIRNQLRLLIAKYTISLSTKLKALTQV